MDMVHDKIMSGSLSPADHLRALKVVLGNRTGTAIPELQMHLATALSSIISHCYHPIADMETRAYVFKWLSHHYDSQVSFCYKQLLLTDDYPTAANTMIRDLVSWIQHRDRGDYRSRASTCCSDFPVTMHEALL